MNERAILIADDDIPTQGLLTTILRGGNAHVVLASDGIAALAAMREREFDVVVLDLMMPRLTGAEVLRAIAAERPEVLDHVIVLTASSPAYFHNAAEVARVRRVLMKPFEIDQLIDALRCCCPDLTFPALNRRTS